MSFLDGVRHRLRVLGQPANYDRELDEEIQFHLALEAMQQEHGGRGAFTSAEARVRARRRFGNPTYLKEEARHMSGLGFFDTLHQDLRFAARTLRRTPGFTAVAVLTLALGIGANTAIFSAVDAMLLRPLPYREPGRLMQLSMVVPATAGESQHEAPWSYLKATVFRDAQRAFSDLTLYSNETVTLHLGEATRERAEVVDDRYLPTLGVRPLLGRNFLPDENIRNAKRRVLISDAFWRRRLNADPSILGRTLDIEREPYTIVGVLPPGFRGLTGQADLWMTIGARRAFMFDPDEAWDHEFNMVARLAPGVTTDRARRDAIVLARRVGDAYPPPQGDAAWGVAARPLDSARVDPIVRRSLIVLLGAVGFVLLIACTNLANMFLVRASVRHREIAVRLAIGASRKRLVRQLLTESFLLSALGGIASIALASWGAQLLSRLNPDTALRAQGLGGLGAVNFATIHLDWRALVFAAVATVLTGLLFGLVPALHATRPSLIVALKEGTSESRASGRSLGRLPTRQLLVVFELALALVLLAGSGTMLRSLAKLLAVDPGFDATRVLTLRLNTPAGPNARDSLPAFYETLLSRLRAIPGVQEAALGDCPPLAGGCNGTVMVFRDRPAVRGGGERVGVHWVTADWFKALRVPLVSGRPFSSGDRIGRRKVVLVNATAARRFWPNESPLGKPVAVFQGGFQDTAYVAGIVGDVRFESIDSVAAADVYISYSQSPRSGAMLFLRTIGDPGVFAAPARRAIQELAPDIPVYDVRTFASRVADATAQARFSALLLALFAVAALVLAGLGIYGVVAFAVAQRTREIGIRVALGASSGDVLRLVVGQGATLIAVGLVLGVAGAFATTRVLRTMLFQVAPSDPPTYVAGVTLLAAAALLATWIPARRAARVQPVEALRE